MDNRLGALDKRKRCCYRYGTKCCALGIFMPPSYLRKHHIRPYASISEIPFPIKEISKEELVSLQVLHDTWAMTLGTDFLIELDKVKERYETVIL